MNFFKKLFGTGPALIAEGVAGAAVKTASGVADIVERWKPSEAARHEMTMAIDKLVNDAAASARSYDPRTQGTHYFSEVVNVLTDALSRMIRPVVTILLIGAVFGWWGIQTKTTDPIVLSWAESTVIFWFGARTLFKDFPSLVAGLKGMRK